jgi:rare lipoprotein A
MGRQFAGTVWRGVARVAALAVGCFALAHCSGPFAGKEYGPRVVEEGQPVPKGGGTYSVGKPYSINGQTYVPAENTSYRVEGIASWYGRDFHGRLTANGEVYDMHSISAAHTTLPMPSYVRVTNLDNGRSLPPQPRHRPFDRDRQRAGLLQPGHCPRTGRICRARAARRKRRRHADGDAA